MKPKIDGDGMLRALGGHHHRKWVHDSHLGLLLGVRICTVRRLCAGLRDQGLVEFHPIMWWFRLTKSGRAKLGRDWKVLSFSLV